MSKVIDAILICLLVIAGTFSMLDYVLLGIDIPVFRAMAMIMAFIFVTNKKK